MIKAIKNIKKKRKKKTTLPNDFYAKKKNMINRDQVKVNALTVVNLDTLVKIISKNPVS